jgi:DNA polymerase V
MKNPAFRPGYISTSLHSPQASCLSFHGAWAFHVPAFPEGPSVSRCLPHPLALTRAGLSGFPSPAQDYEGRTLDLNERLVKRPSATFFMTVTGDSMESLGIQDGDLLVIDRAIEPRPGHILVARWKGSWW